MARITVEDCLAQVHNRFELVLVAAKRARRLLTSADEPFVPWENDKSTVVALREIAINKINRDYLQVDFNREDEDDAFAHEETSK